MSTLLIIGITATAPTSREAVLNPPDEEAEKSEEDEEDDYYDGNDDVAFHDCEWICVWRLLKGLMEVMCCLRGLV